MKSTRRRSHRSKSNKKTTKEIQFPYTKADKSITLYTRKGDGKWYDEKGKYAIHSSKIEEQYQAQLQTIQ